MYEEIGIVLNELVFVWEESFCGCLEVWCFLIYVVVFLGGYLFFNEIIRMGIDFFDIYWRKKKKVINIEN